MTIKKKIFTCVLACILVSMSVFYFEAYAVKRTRYGIYLMGTMYFERKGEIVTNGKDLSVVKNPGYYTATYRNILKKPIRYNKNRVYKIHSAGMWWDLGDDKATVKYEDILGFR